MFVRAFATGAVLTSGINISIAFKEDFSDGMKMYDVYMDRRLRVVKVYSTWVPPYPVLWTKLMVPAKLRNLLDEASYHLGIPEELSRELSRLLRAVAIALHLVPVKISS